MRSKSEIEKKLTFTKIARAIGEERQVVLAKYDIEIETLEWVLCNDSKQSIRGEQR